MVLNEQLHKQVGKSNRLSKFDAIGDARPYDAPELRGGASGIGAQKGRRVNYLFQQPANAILKNANHSISLPLEQNVKGPIRPWTASKSFELAYLPGMHGQACHGQACATYARRPQAAT
jgi:hypothetical protein